MEKQVKSACIIVWAVLKQGEVRALFCPAPLSWAEGMFVLQPPLAATQGKQHKKEKQLSDRGYVLFDETYVLQLNFSLVICCVHSPSRERLHIRWASDGKP